MRNKIFTFIDLIFIIIYLGIGLYFIFSEREGGFIEPRFRVVFGIILVLYGLFRLIRAYRRIKRRYE